MRTFPVSGAEISMNRNTLTGTIRMSLTLDASTLAKLQRNALCHMFYRRGGVKKGLDKKVKTVAYL